MRRNSWNFILAVFSKFPLELIYSFYFILFSFYYLFFFIWYCIPPGGYSANVIYGEVRSRAPTLALLCTEKVSLSCTFY